MYLKKGFCELNNLEPGGVGSCNRFVSPRVLATTSSAVQPPGSHDLSRDMDGPMASDQLMGEDMPLADTSGGYSQSDCLSLRQQSSTVSIRERFEEGKTYIFQHNNSIISVYLCVSSSF